ncbi:UDP-N-acetylmuramate/alanine ligase [Chloroherpeton thalassium ATCC 35110]|uniref:UDP-N-acetylmuramate--L-alanine ligase n=1 Tax=Chloroherpeton thalassium (strain ATCC 35110 / GB-78) TaxID=517418 RepID=B3QWT8_CHLT3|nr:UDP-N-acetylmuramate--L-alanine ligase [Chloroherpeton thalassium]ACF13302.1 UDP-N-acetylmuramate/alanine ligase [Chloroherpeton thalassium ATCC 35110]
MYSALGKIRHVHLIGIGGAGMSAIAEVLLNQGFIVTGSDLVESEVTRRLRHCGATIFIGHDRDNISGADVIVHSSAVKPEMNEEVQEAFARQIPVIKRDEMLGELMRRKAGICIAGTHGKTTTTTMVGTMLKECHEDPTVIIGGISDYFNGSAVVGNGNYMVIEADEYDRTFLKLTPTIGVITTLEAEHLDIYKDLDDLKQAFVQFANTVPFYGAVICCIDEPAIAAILPCLNRRVITYGLTPEAELQAKEVVFHGKTAHFTVTHLGKPLGKLELKAPGLHNVKNALATVAVGLELGLEFDSICRALASFQAVRRRFHVKYSDGEPNGLMVIDDYAHHPTEVRATLEAARLGWPKHHLIAVFQPHLFSRTQTFADEFGKALALADEIIVTDVYASREKAEDFIGVSGDLVVRAVQKAGGKASYIEQKSDIIQQLLNRASAGQMIITMGAGDITKIAGELVEKFNGASKSQ